MSDDKDTNIIDLAKQPKRKLSDKQLAQRRRNIEAAKATVGDKPARSDSSDKSGPGWGGTARPSSRPVGRPIKAVSLKVAEEREALKEQMLGVIVDVAINSPHDAARITAADKALDRIEGKPVQKVISADATEGLREWMISGMSDGDGGSDG